MTWKTRKDFQSEVEYVMYLHQTELEYAKNMDDYVDKGILHPMLDFWFQQSKDINEKPTQPNTFKERYEICKSCEQFKSTTKQCKKCYCFMPLKAQFAFFNCPEGKW